jgi:hypothetical protein
MLPYSKYHAPGEVPYCGQHVPPTAPDEENSDNTVGGGQEPEEGPEED